jgi:helix-destabilizing protein
MTLRVKIEDATVHSRNFAAKEGRDAFQAKSQTGILQCGKFVYPLNIRLGAEQAPYAPGEYIVEDESFGVDEYDNVSIRRGGLKLKSALVDAVRRPASA